MRKRSRAFGSLAIGIGLFAVAFFLCGAAPARPGGEARTPQKQPACMNQAPRALAGVPWDREPVSRVQNVTDDTVTYQGQTLHRCSQHFHCTIETFQGCEGQSVSPVPGPHECPPPRTGGWVEVHTAYAKHAGCVGPVPECCLEPPFVVLGYHARVAAGGAPGRLPVIRDGSFAEFLGSTSGPDTEEGPAPCKPEAEWSFTLGCTFSVTAAQLGPHGEGARPLQDRVSRDLILVPRVR